MRKSIIAVTAAVLLSLALFLSLQQQRSVNPQVKEYIGQLPKAESSLTTKPPVPKPEFFARKDTLKVNGDLIIGNWVPAVSNAGCTSQNNMALLLSKIDHFDDLGPCPNGSSLVRAVFK